MIAAQVPGIAGLLGLAVGVVIIAALFLARDVLIPITLAILLSFVLSPIVVLLRRARIPKAGAVMLAVLSALGLVGAIGTTVGLQFATLAADAPAYVRTIEAKVERASDFAARQLQFLERQSATPAAPVPAAEPGRLERAAATATTASREPIPVRVTERRASTLEVAGQWLAPAVSPIQTFIIVLVVAIFILMQKEDLRDRMIRLFGSSDLHRTTVAIDDAGARLARYFLSQLAVNSGYGIIVTIGLWAIGLPVPALWGVLAAVLRFVPYVGSILGSVLPLIVAAGVDPGWTMVIMVALLFLILDPILGYVVEPLLYGHSTGLSPFAVILAAVFWTWIWGPLGLVLSMPLTLCLVVMGRHIPSLEFIDVMLGDRPALTPTESFYQRMLADDPDEAAEQAERFLEERSLTAYYDEVALGGLKLAAADVGRGVVDDEGAERIVVAMRELVDELGDDYDPNDVARPVVSDLNPISPASDGAEDPEPMTPVQVPESWGRPESVVCVAGRGVLDEAVTAMLDQLLTHRGFGVSSLGNRAVAREGISGQEFATTRLFCLSYLEIGGTPAHLRYLVRRLRRRASGARVIVGMWPSGEAVLNDREIQKALGADAYVSSLDEAVRTALSIAAESKD